jgi:hypothetical protein
MGNDDNVFDFGRAHRTSTPPSEALTWHTPVRFDPGVLKKLLDQHDALDACVASLPNRFRRDPEQAWRVANACAGQLHELRRQEALWIYPVIAHGLDNDPSAMQRLLSLRFGMNGLARRVLRRIEELSNAVRQVTDIAAAVASVVKTLAEYRQRNESELYTLYSLMDPRRARVVARANGQALNQ